jgi:H-type lectin domain
MGKTDEDLKARVTNIETSIKTVKIWVAVITAMITAVGGTVATSLYQQYSAASTAASQVEDTLRHGLKANFQYHGDDSEKNGCQRILDFQMCWGTFQGTSNKSGEAKHTFTFPAPFEVPPVVTFSTSGVNFDGESQYDKFAPFAQSSTVTDASVAAETTNEARQEVSPVTISYVAVGKPVKEK